MSNEIAMMEKYAPYTSRALERFAKSGGKVYFIPLYESIISVSDPSDVNSAINRTISSYAEIEDTWVNKAGLPKSVLRDIMKADICRVLDSETTMAVPFQIHLVHLDENAEINSYNPLYRLKCSSDAAEYCVVILYANELADHPEAFSNDTRSPKADRKTAIKIQDVSRHQDTIFGINDHVRERFSAPVEVLNIGFDFDRDVHLVLVDRDCHAVKQIAKRVRKTMGVKKIAEKHIRDEFVTEFMFSNALCSICEDSWLNDRNFSFGYEPTILVDDSASKEQKEQIISIVAKHILGDELDLADAIKDLNTKHVQKEDIRHYDYKVFDCHADKENKNG